VASLRKVKRELHCLEKTCSLVYVKQKCPSSHIRHGEEEIGFLELI
jgi:hypothetical protein